jgi:hypothetical protein
MCFYWAKTISVKENPQLSQANAQQLSFRTIRTAEIEGAHSSPKLA